MELDRPQLRGWKEIASYLHSSERSVKRWEGSRGLPIHRVSGKSRDAVFARPDELDRWRERRDVDTAPDDPVTSLDSTVAPEQAGPDYPLPTGTRPRRRPTSALLASGAGVLLTMLIAAYYVLSTSPGVERAKTSTVAPVTSGAMREISVAAVKPSNQLRLSTVNGWKATIGIADGNCGTVEMSKQLMLRLCPRPRGDRLLVDILPLAIPTTPGPANAPQQVTVLLTRDEQIGVLTPIRFDVEWVSTGAVSVMPPAAVPSKVP